MRGSLVINVDGLKLDAKFLRENGAIDDEFTILKGAEQEPLRWATFKLKNGIVEAQWKSIAGRVYQVERVLDLTKDDWIAVSGEIIASGATTLWLGAAPQSEFEEYYRVRDVK